MVLCLLPYVQATAEHDTKTTAGITEQVVELLRELLPPKNPLATHWLKDVPVLPDIPSLRPITEAIQKYLLFRTVRFE